MTTNSAIKMKPTKELLYLAKLKAEHVLPGCEIRLGGGEYSSSYYLFNFGGLVYIGSHSSEPLSKFFKNRPEYSMVNKDGIEIGKVQRLM